MSSPRASVEVDRSEELLVRCEERVATITLNRPHLVNAISLDLAQRFRKAVGTAAAEADVIVVRGGGDHFSAGADLTLLTECGDDETKMREVISAISSAFAELEAVDVPVIAAVRGYALAGGFELMQACDLVVVAEDAVIGDQHSNFGLVPGGGGSQRLPRLCGRQRALGLLLTGDRIDGNAAVDLGLAYRAVPSADTFAAAASLAQALASKSRESLRVMKRLVDRGAELPLDVALELEIDANVTHSSHPDFREGIAAFHARRVPEFKSEALPARSDGRGSRS